MRGTRVKIIRPVQRGVDSHGNSVKVDSVEYVDNVLVNKPSTQDLIDNQAMMTGYTLNFTLGFPKTFTGELRGCRVVIPIVNPNYEFAVIGNPQPVPHNCPTQWNRKVEVGTING